MALIDDQRRLIAQRESLMFAHWDAGAEGGDDSVLYHVPSGDTHVVNGAGRLILERLCGTPSTLMEVVAYLEDSVGHVADVDLTSRCHSLLLRFEELGLIEAERRSFGP